MLKPVSYELDEDFFPEIDVPEKYNSVINTIAQYIDARMVCFLNPETLETDAYPIEVLSEIGAFEPEESRERMQDLYGWDELKFLDWETTIEFSPLPSHERFRIMEAFAERLDSDKKTQSQLIDALNRRKPFANFNHIIHNSDWREAWFDFKQKWMENEVAVQLKMELEKLANLPKFESGIYNDDGTKVDENAIPVPNLCVVCKKHHSDDWEEDILCKLNRNDQRDDLDNFECGAYEKI